MGVRSREGIPGEGTLELLQRRMEMHFQQREHMEWERGNITHPNTVPRQRQGVSLEQDEDEEEPDHMS